MDDLTIAKIVFAETGTLLPNASTPNALTDARWALATAIRAADGVGFAPPLEPTAIVLADDDARRAWNDCRAAATKRPPMADVLSTTICVFDDQELTAAKADAALTPVREAGTPWASIGKFQSRTGEIGYLYLYNGVAGVSSGRYPRDKDRPVVAGATPGQTVAKLAARVSHGGALGIALLVFVCVFGLIGYWAHDKGVTLAALNASPPDHKTAFEQRLDMAMAPITLPGGKRVDPATLDRFVKQPLEAMLFPAAPAVPSPVTAEQAKADTETLRAGLTGADAFKAIPEVERRRVVDDILNAATTTVASDPSFQWADLVWPWIAAAVTVAVIIALAGLLIRGTCLGALIDNRNRLSLSLTQMAGWSVLVFSLFYVTSLFLIGVSPVNQIVLPVYDQGVWALLGISFGSAATSGIILAQKDQPGGQAADPNAPAGAPASKLDKNDDPNDWSMKDLFMGEEVVNADTTDLSRVQHLVITVILMIVFCAMTVAILQSIGWQSSWTDWASHAAPALWSDKTFLGLLGVSHAGYLVFKGMPKQSGAQAPSDTTKSG